MIRRVITDSDVLTGAVSSPIVLDEHTLLTPAARDRAVQKGLVIVERGAASSRRVQQGQRNPAANTESAPAGACAGRPSIGCARCGSSVCGGDCATCAERNAPGDTARGPAPPATPLAAPLTGLSDAGLDGLPDGLHLVRVERGHVVSVLPAAGTGLMQPARGGTAS